MALFKGIKIKKVKISLAVFFGLLIVSFTMFSYAQENSTSNKNIFLDSDQDGLSDAEEKVYGTDPFKADTDSDGYSDGQEVKSGYNPLVPAPNDKIISSSETKASAQSAAPVSPTSASSNSNTASSSTKSTASKASTDNQNVTQELSSQLTDLINNKTSGSQDISMDDLDSIIGQLTASSTLTFDDLPDIDSKEIKIKKQNYSNLSESDRQAKEKDDAEQYMTAVSYIFLNNAPTKITKSDDLNNFSKEVISQVQSLSDSFSNISYFENLAVKGSDMLKELKDVEVPADLVDIHIKGLQLITYAVSLKDKYKINSDDPASSVLALSEVENLMSLFQQYSSDSGEKLTELGVSTLPLNLQ
jgi:hypothetical protein